MSCDTGIKARKPVKKESTISQQYEQSEKKSMSSSMVRQEMPSFTLDAYDAKSGHFI